MLVIFKVIRVLFYQSSFLPPLFLPVRCRSSHTHQPPFLSPFLNPNRCEVDPHCCCAELGTEGPIRVDFVASNGKNAGRLGEGKDTNYNFFNEQELVKLSSGGGETKG